MIVLSIDTSGKPCTVAVNDDFTLLAHFTVQNAKTHSVTLMPLVERVLHDAGVSKKEIAAVAVSEGPGSFTGLRIGAASAKAMGLALDIPLIGVPTLTALACNLAGTSGLLCPMMDARRQQVYAGLYEWTAQGLLRELMPDAPFAVEELTSLINARGEHVCFTGDGALVYAQVLREYLTVPFSFAPMSADHQNAASTALLAAWYLCGDEAQKETVRALKVHEETADAFTPVYLRPAQAERESVLIRRMEEKDIEGVHALERMSFSRPWTVQMFEDVLHDAHSIALVAVTGNGRTDAARIVGSCFVKNIAGEGTVTNVNVDRDFRRQGIAEAMLNDLLEEGRAAGIGEFTLEVRESNTAARKLYEKCGFVSEGVRPDFYEEPKEDAQIYWLRG